NMLLRSCIRGALAALMIGVGATVAGGATGRDDVGWPSAGDGGRAHPGGVLLDEPEAATPGSIRVAGRRRGEMPRHMAPPPPPPPPETPPAAQPAPAAP